MRVVMVAFLKGVAPIMAVEIGRRAVPGHVRPSFKEVEQACRNRGSSAATPAPEAAGTDAAPAPEAAAEGDAAAAAGGAG
jgi:chemotaxis protein MotA